MNKNFAKIGFLAVTSLIASSAFAFGSFEVKVAAPEVAPKLAQPNVSVSPGHVTAPSVKVAPKLDMSGFNAAFALKEMAKEDARPSNSCESGLPARMAAVSGKSVARVNELIAKRDLNLASSCDIAAAGDEAIKNMVNIADIAETRGSNSTADDEQLIKVLASAADEAFALNGQKIEDAEGRMRKVHKSCEWLGPFPEGMTVHAGPGSIN